MNKDKLLKNVTIKSEPVSPTAKKIILSSSLIPPSAIKKEPSSRLPSFKPPRDLLLTGSTTSHATPNLKDFISTGNKPSKRKYTPNVNIFRKKGLNNLSSECASEVDTKTKVTDQSKKSPSVNKKKNTNFIQTKGVFSEGLAPGKVKSYTSSYSERSSSESNVLEKPKLVLNQKINKINEDAKLQTLLRDDFVDDPHNTPDLSFLPNSLPTIYNAKHKFQDSKDIEKTFQNLQVKIEKVAKNEDMKDYKSEVFGTFEENECPKLLLFEFPEVMHSLDDADDKRKPSQKAQSGNETDSKTKPGKLSSIGEGHWGYLRIHKSGNAYFVVGSSVIPISLCRHIARQEVMSTSIDQTVCKGEIINLGTIDASFTCSTNFDNIR